MRLPGAKTMIRRNFLKLCGALLGAIFLPRPKPIRAATQPFEESETGWESLVTSDGRIVTYNEGRVHRKVIRTAKPNDYAGNYVYIPEEYRESAAYNPLAFGWEVEGPVEVTYCFNHCPGMHHFAGEFVRPLPGSKLVKRVSLCTSNFAGRLYWREFYRAVGGLDMV
jgi:hypothetical protein